MFMNKVMDDSIENKNIGYNDMMACIRGPWEAAFTTPKNKRAWEVTGLSPLNRRVYWKN